MAKTQKVEKIEPIKPEEKATEQDLLVQQPTAANENIEQLLAELSTAHATISSLKAELKEAEALIAEQQLALSKPAPAGEAHVVKVGRDRYRFTASSFNLGGRILTPETATKADIEKLVKIRSSVLRKIK